MNAEGVTPIAVAASGPTPLRPANAADAATPSVPVSQPALGPDLSAPPDPSWRRRRRTWIAVATGVLLIGAAATATVLASDHGDHGPSYTSQLGNLLQPVLGANSRLAVALNGLSGPTGAAPGLSAMTTAETAIQVDQQSVAQLRPSRADAEVTAALHAFLDSEMAWLQSAAAVLKDASSPQLTELAALGVDVQSKLQTLGASLPVAAGARFPSSDQVIEHASAVTAAANAKAKTAAEQAQAAAGRARTTAAEVQFSTQVLALLGQSAPSFQSINQLFQQLQAVAQGGFATITLAQAEQQIGDIVANRTSLQAAAQALSAPTPATGTVHDDLVVAFGASRRDDTDLNTCLNEDNSGVEAIIFESCLNASTADNNAASAAKQTFAQDYNRLRAALHQPAVDIQF